MEAHSRTKAHVSEQAADAEGTSPAALARNVLDTFLAQRWHTLQDLIHPDADVEAGFSFRGTHFDAKQVLEAAWAAGTSGTYRPEYDLIVTLDDKTALVTVRIKFQLGEDHITKRGAAYLMTFKDSLLWRNRVFNSVEEALTAHRAGQAEPPEAV